MRLGGAGWVLLRNFAQPYRRTANSEPPNPLNPDALFPAPATSGYLNCASRAPQLHSVAEAAREALRFREHSAAMPVPAFFSTPAAIRQEFAKLIGGDDRERIAMIPAVSYGVATVAHNVDLRAEHNVIVAADQFPSNYYTWAERCKAVGAELRVVARPEPGSVDTWSDRLLAAIDADTAVVAGAHVHWADGTPFDLVALRQRTDEVGAWLVVDGTQSVGALAFDVGAIRPDALVCGGYKWLMGPYGCGYAYYGERMDGGHPIEENWINRAGSEDFRNLVNYADDYRPRAGRYCVGEHSNFLMAPMQLAALRQVNAWGPAAVQEHTAALWGGVGDDLAALGVHLPSTRAHHLVGLRLPAGTDGQVLAKALEERDLKVSYRGDAVRVSPHVYNTGEEMARLVEAIGRATP